MEVRTMRHHLLTAATLIAVIGLGACGEDAGAASEACDAFVAIDRELSINEDLEAGIAALVAFVEEAPDDVADAVEPLIPLLQEDPEAAFESEELAIADVAADDYALENCHDTRVDIEAVNFAFAGVPDEIDAGRVAFAITNHTQTDEVHEALLLRKNDGADTPAHEVLAAALNDRPVSVETTLASFEQFTLVGGGLVEPPGGDGFDVFVVDVEPGEYILACLLPENSSEKIEPYFGGEEVEGRYHFHHGMFAEFTVT
jgi:hypothetical protein